MIIKILRLTFLFVAAFCLTCDEILELPNDTKLTFQQLQSSQPKEIVQCLAHLGKERLGQDEADFIWKTIVMYYNGIANVPDKVLMLLHWVTTALTPEDYSNITLSSIDVIVNFGLDYNLNPAQLSAIADRVREDFAGKEPEDYTFYDLTALRQILCSFNRSEIERIRPKAYREAAVVIGKLQKCSSDVMMGFATLAIQKSAFGLPATWTESTKELVGAVAEYLAKYFKNVEPDTVQSIANLNTTQNDT